MGKQEYTGTSGLGASTREESEVRVMGQDRNGERRSQRETFM